VTRQYSYAFDARMSQLLLQGPTAAAYSDLESKSWLVASPDFTGLLQRVSLSRHWDVFDREGSMLRLD
jgi:hypothetical protein